jgi:PAS domain S-box-containing protein
MNERRPMSECPKTERTIALSDHYKTSWTRDLSLVDAHGQEIPTEIHGTMINHDASSFLVMQIIDIGAYETRSQNVSTHNLHAKGLMEWDRARDFFREMENENRLILDAAGEGIYGINLEGKTTFVNKAAQEMLGWTKEDLLGEDIHAMIHHHHLDGRKYPSRECPIYHSFRNEQVNRVEDEVFWHKNGRPIQVEYTSTPIYDQQVLAGAVVIFRDVSERRENERKLRAAMDQIRRPARTARTGKRVPAGRNPQRSLALRSCRVFPCHHAHPRADRAGRQDPEQCADHRRGRHRKIADCLGHPQVEFARQATDHPHQLRGHLARHFRKRAVRPCPRRLPGRGA